jgi:hypothetical protein
MLKRFLFLSLMVMTLSFFTEKTTRAQGITIDYFYDQLAPYGHWENVAPFGWVWQPSRVAPGWRPYSDGYWVYTSYGWTYQADNNWAWAVYHYGRWTFDDYLGWLWVPGNEWAPAWVAWRNDGQYVGWAALPPQAVWNNGGFRSPHFNIDVDIHWANWCFVDNDHFDNPRVAVYIINPARNVTYVKRTRDITRYEYRDNHYYNHCIDVVSWERDRHRKIHRYDVIDVDRSNKVRISTSRRQVNVYRPAFVSSRAVGEPRNRGVRGESNQRYNRERDRYDKHYDKAYYDLVEKQKREDAARDEIRRQHDDERNAYREQRNRDTRVLENRHVNELERNTRPGNGNNKVDKGNNGRGNGNGKSNGNGNNGRGKGNGNGNVKNDRGSDNGNSNDNSNGNSNRRR